MLEVQSVTVRSDRLVCIVRVTPPTSRTSSPELAELILSRYPDLCRHACVNDAGPTFAHVMDSTSLPHVLEHMVIDLQLAQLAVSDQVIQGNRSLMGSTQWVNARKGTARVEVGYWDDLVALRALNQAVRDLNEFCQQKITGL